MLFTSTYIHIWEVKKKLSFPNKKLFLYGPMYISVGAKITIHPTTKYMSCRTRLSTLTQAPHRKRFDVGTYEFVSKVPIAYKIPPKNQKKRKPKT